MKINKEDREKIEKIRREIEDNILNAEDEKHIWYCQGMAASLKILELIDIRDHFDIVLGLKNRLDEIQEAEEEGR